MTIPYIATYSDFRANMAKWFDKVENDSLPLVVLRRGGKKMIVISEDDYKAMDETEYLLSTEANRKHLLEAINEPARNRKKYKSVDEIREEFGIK